MKLIISKSVIFMFKTLVIGVGLGAMAGYVAHVAMNIPEVHISHSTQECVEVLNFKESDKYTCENLPSRYSHVWVK